MAPGKAAAVVFQFSSVLSFSNGNICVWRRNIESEKESPAATLKNFGKTNSQAMCLLLFAFLLKIVFSKALEKLDPQAVYSEVIQAFCGVLTSMTRVPGGS